MKEIEKPTEIRAKTRERFKLLAKKWRKETSLYSSALAMSQHPAYQEIIQMGHEAIPLILQELQQKPDHWFMALIEITKENVAGKATNFSEAVSNCIKWGKEKGYLV